MPRYSLQDMKDAKAALRNKYLGTAAARPRLRAFASVANSASPNVVGLGLGLKVSGGKETRTQCVRFYVEKKVPKSSIAAADLLPNQIEGIATDVIETGRFHALDVTAANNKKRRRPARPGCSIGFQFPPPKDNYVMAGTFGAVVSRGGKKHILSNNHVLAENGLIQPGGAIFQPGLLDGGDAGADQIAALTQFIPVVRTGGNLVDCGIAEVTSGSLVSAVCMPKVGALSSPKPIAAKINMQVMKTGRTTGHTRGRITDVNADITIPYEDSDGEFDAVFTDQIVIVGTIGSFSNQGDSGSLIVDEATKRATGLLFAGSPSTTIANHIENVLTALGVQLVV